MHRMMRDDTLTAGSRLCCELPGTVVSRTTASGVRHEAHAVVGVGLALLVTWGVVVATAAWGWAGMVIAASWPSGLAAAWHDLRTHRLLAGLTVLAGAAPAAFAVIAALTGSWRPAGAAVAGAAAMALPLIAVHLTAPAAMGFGDVKLAMALGLGLGLVDWRLALLGLASGTAAAIVWAASQRRRSVPFGPGLVAGSVLAGSVAAMCALAGSPLLGWEVLGWEVVRWR